MRSHPILFSAPMVLAILSGQKTQTRRIVANPYTSGPWSIRPAHAPRFPGHTHDWWLDAATAPQAALKCPYGQPGDRLWVRETWAHVPSTAYRCSEGVVQTEDPGQPGMAAVYAAGWERCSPGRWRPSIHMPRWACRLVLEVTEVRVHRLQEISERDATAEGFSPITRDCKVPKFQALWESIHGPGAWDANPWVWAVSFRRVQG